MIAISTFTNISNPRKNRHLDNLEDSGKNDKRGGCPENPKSCKTLREAVRSGSLEAVKYFIEEKKVNVDGLQMKVMRNTPLCEAVVRGHLQIVKYLIEKNADVNKRCIFYMPPLILAIRYHEFEIVKFLVQNFAKISQTDIAGNSPLHHAAIEDMIEIAEFLLTQQRVKVNSANADGNTPLHFAASYSSVEMVKLFVENKADFKAINKNGKTPLDMAKFYENKDIVDYLEAKSGAYRRSMVPMSTKLFRNISSQPRDKPLITVKRLGLNRSKSVIEAMPSNIINTLFLLNLAVRYFTKQKYTNTPEESVSESEAQANSLKITENFEDLLKFYGSIPAEQFDLVEIHSNIYKAIKSGRGDKIHEILCSYFKPLLNLNSDKTQELLLSVLANNPLVKLPKAEMFDASVFADLPSSVFNSCIYSSSFHFK